MKRFLTATLLVAPALALAQATNPLKYAPRPTTPAITPADLMTRVYVFADDSMLGRQSGTAAHDKGTDYIARELRRLGLRPAGENGTFFQQMPLVTSALIAAESKMSVGGREFLPGRDFLPRNAGDFRARARDPLNSPVVYGGMFGDTAAMIKPDQVAGKVVIFTVPRGWQANRGALLAFYPAAAAVVVATLDVMPDPIREQLAAPSTIVRGPEAAACNPADLSGCTVPTFFYVTRAFAESMFGGPVAGAAGAAGAGSVTGQVRYADERLPGTRNVVAVLPGSDPKLAGTYVAIGSHSDHDGVGEAVDHDSLRAFNQVVRPGGADDGDKEASAGDWPRIRARLDSLRQVHRPRVDSIFNGADDDASGSMGMLEVAEAFAGARVKPKRSILFVWHVAEEQGLLGSAYFTDNPTVPRDSIVAQINIDMIGRGGAQDMPGGGPGYLQLIGSRRLSTQLGDIVEAEGKKFTPPFRYDYQFDANGHPQQYYCRSDHYNYAKWGIPVVFMSTGGHAEYHQQTDEPQYLDYDQLARVTQLVFNVASSVANLDQRPVVDKPKPDPRGQCVQ